MDLDETWQVGLTPEKTKACTFPAKLRDGFRREREKMDSAQLCTNRCDFAGNVQVARFHFPAKSLWVQGLVFLGLNPTCQVSSKSIQVSEISENDVPDHYV